MTIRVLLVDDQEMVRRGFAMVLEAEDDLIVVGEAEDGQAALDVVRSTSVDVVVMDVRMPRMDGVASTRAIRAEADAPEVLILTTFDLDEYVYEALRAGAGGFLLKDAGTAELFSAIRHIHAGDAVVAPSATRRLLERFAVTASPEGHDRPPTAAGRGLSTAELQGSSTSDAAAQSSADAEASLLEESLTPRETEIVRMIARGLSNAEIAAELVLAEGTVKTHVSNVLTKLDLRDRVQIAVTAFTSGLVRGPAD